MKKLSLFVVLLNSIILNPCFSECEIENDHFQSKSEIVNECLRESIRLKMDYLPSYIQEHSNICKLTSNSNDEMDICLTNLISSSSEIILCEQSSKRQRQMAEYDQYLFDNIINENKQAVVPASLKNKIFEMAIKNGLNITIEAYQSSVLNAHAGANQKILLSAGLWSSQSTLTEDEILAIVAHELGHIQENHSLKIGCHALEWVGPYQSLKEALLTFREDFSLVSDRGISYSKKSNGLEFRADFLAISILKKSGLNPRLMGDALNKLAPKNKSGFSSGSHPEISERITRAYENAAIVVE